MKEPAETIIKEMRMHMFNANECWTKILMSQEAFDALTSLEREYVKLAIKHMDNADKRLFAVRYRECKPLRRSR